MSYIYDGDSPDHLGKYLYAPGGQGILGSLVPSSGEGGRPGLLYNEVQTYGWQTKAVRLVLVSATRPGLKVNDDTSWEWVGLVDGVHTAVYKAYVDGVLEPGTAQLVLTVGGDVIAATVTMVDGGGDRVSAVASVVAQGLQMSATLADRGGDRVSVAITVQPFGTALPTLTPGLRQIKAGTRTPVKLAPLDVAETDDVAILFASTPGQLSDPILLVDILAEARVGVDANTAPLLVGAYQVDGDIVLQRISGAIGLPGVTYLMRANATRVSGRRETASAFLKVLRKL